MQRESSFGGFWHIGHLGSVVLALAVLMVGLEHKLGEWNSLYASTKKNKQAEEKIRS